MNDVRGLRRSAGLLQSQLAVLLGVPVNTLRMWDSGLRPIPAAMFVRLKRAVALQQSVAKLAQPKAKKLDGNALAPLKVLAAEFCVHVSTLQVAARTGKLAVHVSERSAFGRPLVRWPRAAWSLRSQRQMHALVTPVLLGNARDSGAIDEATGEAAPITRLVKDLQDRPFAVANFHIVSR